MKRSGGKREGAMQEKLFTKIKEKWINNIEEEIIIIYIVYLENWWRKVTYIWKVKLSRPWTFGNDSEFMSFLNSTDSSNLEVWLSLLDKSISKFFNGI